MTGSCSLRDATSIGCGAAAPLSCACRLPAYRSAVGAGKERDDGLNDAWQVPRIGEVEVPFERDQPGIGDAAGELSAAPVRDDSVAPVMHHQSGCGHLSEQTGDVAAVHLIQVSGGHV